MNLPFTYTLRRPCADVASILILLNTLDVVLQRRGLCITVITLHIVVNVIRTQSHRKLLWESSLPLLHPTEFLIPALLLPHYPLAIQRETLFNAFCTLNFSTNLWQLWSRFRTLGFYISDKRLNSVSVLPLSLFSFSLSRFAISSWELFQITNIYISKSVKYL